MMAIRLVIAEVAQQNLHSDFDEALEDGYMTTLIMLDLSVVLEVIDHPILQKLL